MTKNSEKPLVVGLAGFGTVGGGLVRLLDENAELIRRRCGRAIVLKKGTKVKNIRIVDGDHDIDCKVDGVSLSLKSEFLKKA